jgi:nucleoid DNA-binding protein
MSGKVLSQNDMIALVAQRSEYYKYEVQDVLRSFFIEMKVQLEQGNQVHFEKLFRVHIERPMRKRIYSPADNACYLSPAHPKLKLTPTQDYKHILWTGYTGEVFLDRNKDGL